MDDTPRDAPDTGAGGFADLPVQVSVLIGTARPKIRDLLELRPGAVLPLDRRLEDPVELYIGDRLVARGRLETDEASDDGRLHFRLGELFAGPTQAS